MLFRTQLAKSVLILLSHFRWLKLKSRTVEYICLIWSTDSSAEGGQLLVNQQISLPMCDQKPWDIIDPGVYSLLPSHSILLKHYCGATVGGLFCQWTGYTRGLWWWSLVHWPQADSVNMVTVKIKYLWTLETCEKRNRVHVLDWGSFMSNGKENKEKGGRCHYLDKTGVTMGKDWKQGYLVNRSSLL